MLCIVGIGNKGEEGKENALPFLSIVDDVSFLLFELNPIIGCWIWRLKALKAALMFFCVWQVHSNDDCAVNSVTSAKRNTVRYNKIDYPKSDNGKKYC